jgi:hypothetical protein
MEKVRVMNEIDKQRGRLSQIFEAGIYGSGGTCDGICDICILCDNAGGCMAEAAIKLLYEDVQRRRKECTSLNHHATMPADTDNAH